MAFAAGSGAIVHLGTAGLFAGTAFADKTVLGLVLSENPLVIVIVDPDASHTDQSGIAKTITLTQLVDPGVSETADSWCPLEWHSQKDH